MKILVTGAAGFIGYHLAQQLLQAGHDVVGIDNLNHYYDVRLKLDRLKELGIDAYEIAMGKEVIDSDAHAFRFLKLDLINHTELNNLFEREQFDVVYNLAAQAGVRYSIEHPRAYTDSNVVGFANLLEACRHFSIKHFIYASSSSVYGNSKKVPFQTTDNVDHPISFYAATKKSNELMGHVYSYLFKIPMTGLRFFTVYGEWGRPDMATMLFAKAIMNDETIKVFNEGNLSRDFTYVGDIVEGMIKVMDRFNSFDQAPPELPMDIRYKLYNIGNSKPVNLLRFIEVMEDAFGKKVTKEMYPMQPGDVDTTYADVSELVKDVNYRPSTKFEEGIAKFVKWYKGYYH